MTDLRVKDWDKWQSYRKGRGQPPWIKIHRRLMRNEKWVLLTDAQRGQLVAIWMLAADHNGAIPASPAVVRKLCHMDSEPDFNLFIDNDFLEMASNGCQRDAIVASDRRQHVTPETETETEKDKKEDDGANAPAERVSHETSKPSLIESPSGLATKYAFEGHVVKLKQVNFDNWVKAFPALDLRGELIARDAWLSSDRATDDDRRNWFHSTPKYLANRNLEANAKATAFKGGPKLDLNNPSDVMRFILS